MTDKPKKPMPRFKTWKEAMDWLVKEEGAAPFVDRTKEMEGKALVWFPGLYVNYDEELPDEEKDL